MNNVFNNNLLNLRQACRILAAFSLAFSFVPIVFEDFNFIKTGVYVGVAVLSFVLSIVSNYMIQMINVKKSVIYTMVLFFYLILVFFGTYLDVFSNRSSVAAILPCFLICSLLLFVNPPQFNLSLTLIGMSIFIVSALLSGNIDADSVVFYLINGIIAGILSLFFSWHITKLRMGLELSASKLEEERNKYVDQSITDELTQLRNRRDFNQTFQRFLSNYRTSDEWLCVALADIDFFKFYNDHYGHPQGDECLKGIGAALNSLSNLGVYAARVGGEEFALLWFEKDPTHVKKIIMQWTETIRNLKILHEKSKVSEYVTMSIGVYVIRCGTHHDTKTLY
ncbi:MAG: diguanylate cyclase, partial [Treponema sp.]|nr:diguanylate cyclase [Treponema sp.]